MHTPQNISLTNYSKSTIHKTKPSKNRILPSEHLTFTFYFIANCPNYIFKLNLPMNLARLCTTLSHQRSVESSFIKIVEDYSTKQNKHKKLNKIKSKNKKVLNYKPTFTPREHEFTSPIHTSPPTDTITVTQNTQPRFK